jgi:hypothetical protein
MLVLHDLSIAFNDEFDIGLSYRGLEKLMWNGGVVFVKNTDPARAFMRAWKEADDYLFANPSVHQKWRTKFGGMNQASLGYLLSHDKSGAKIKKFPCQIWNSVLEYWDKVDDKTMVLHVKSGLRKEVIQNKCTRWKKACELWYSYARCCGVQTPTSGNINLFQYKNYDEYVKTQKKFAVEKRKMIWADKNYLAYLTKYVMKKMKPSFGICHGTRNGAEQKYFMALFPKCSVIGTEIADFASEVEHTVKHDFNLPKDEWIGKADFVYSNAFDHAYDPSKTIRVWLAQLKTNGMLIIEHSTNHSRPPTAMDPFAFNSAQMTALINEWTKGRYRVSTIISPPIVANKRPHHRVHDTRFIIIERSLTHGEQLEKARSKAMGHSR